MVGNSSSIMPSSMIGMLSREIYKKYRSRSKGLKMGNNLICIVPTSLTALKDRKMEEKLEERSDGGYWERITSIHFPVLYNHEQWVNGKHFVTELGRKKCGNGWKGKLRYLINLYTTIRWSVSPGDRNLIKVHDPYVGGFIAWLASKKANVPFMVSLRTPEDLRYRLVGPTYLFPKILGSRWLAKKLRRFVLSRAHGVMARSMNLLKEAEKDGAKNLLLDRFQVAQEEYNEPNLPIVAFAVERIQKEIPDCKLLVSIGRLSKENYVDDIVEIHRRVRQTHPKTALLFIGDGPEYKRLSDSTIGQNVIFYGWRPYAEIPTWRKLADINICLMAGNSLVEAALGGRPIVAYDVDWHNELIEKTKWGGLLLSEGDIQGAAESIRDLLDYPDYAIQVSISALKIAKTFHDIETNMQRRQAWYTDLLDKYETH